MTIDIQPVILNGEFYTVKQFATITNRSPQTIYALVSKGNSIRKLTHIKLENFVLIPKQELVDFPFTNTGRNAKASIYHYDEEGNVTNINELEDVI